MNSIAGASLLLLVATFGVNAAEARRRDANVTATFTNPILDGDAADPAMIKIGGYYYLTYSGAGWNHITIRLSPIMTDFRNSPSKRIFTAPPEYVEVWAPEFHIIDGELFIYFTMAGAVAIDHRMYVMKAEDPNNPMGNWVGPTLISPEGGIDVTVLKHGNGKNYFVWSAGYSLWIAEMINPYLMSTNIVKIRSPETDWECGGGCCDEGPFFLYNRGVSYLVFSAGSTWGPDYCLGLMSVAGDKDPMNAANWWYGPNGPVFYKNEAESVYTVGHAAFIASPDGTETWMSYHGTVNGYGDRSARLEKIEWNDDGTPRFPRPHGFGSAIEVPHGQ